jgi:hypothetical protein
VDAPALATAAQWIVTSTSTDFTVSSALISEGAKMSVRFLAALAIAAATLTGADAQDRPRAVIELFTSQGCSSCPPADRLMSELSRDPGLVVITMPVDYWDYLGWKDTLAQPGFTARQRGYSWLRGDRQVYTPQAVINGASHAIGSEKAAVENAIGMSQAQPGTLSMDVRIERGGQGLAVVVLSDGQRGGHVWVVPTAAERLVKIGRGENHGRSVTYSNVALGLTRIGEVSGRKTTLEVPRSAIVAEADGLVVLVQGGGEKKAGQVLGAARISLASQ